MILPPNQHEENRTLLTQGTDPSYLPGHAAAVFLQLADQKPVQIGSFGVMHPLVLKNFELPFPTSTLELNLEHFL